MNKKGFTMIELLMVIAILGMISLILVPGAIEMSNQNNIKSCQSLEKNIISAAKMYVEENKYDLGFECGVEKDITIDNLITYGKLSSPVKNPITKEDVTKQVKVTYDCTQKTFDYEFSLGCEEK